MDRGRGRKGRDLKPRGHCHRTRGYKPKRAALLTETLSPSLNLVRVTRTPWYVSRSASSTVQISGWCSLPTRISSRVYDLGSRPRDRCYFSSIRAAPLSPLPQDRAPLSLSALNTVPRRFSDASRRGDTTETRGRKVRERGGYSRSRIASRGEKSSAPRYASLVRDEEDRAGWRQRTRYEEDYSVWKFVETAAFLSTTPGEEAWSSHSRSPRFCFSSFREVSDGRGHVSSWS